MKVRVHIPHELLLWDEHEERKCRVEVLVMGLLVSPHHLFPHLMRTMTVPTSHVFGGHFVHVLVILRQDLEAADRTLTPWVVAMMHCPWYNSNLAHQGERQAEIAMRVIEPLLVEHKVAIVVAGHVHGELDYLS